LPSGSIVIGVAQFSSGRSPLDSWRRLSELLESRYREADLVILPEYSDVNVALHSRGSLWEHARGLEDNPFLSKLSDLASRLGFTALVGVLEKRDKCLYSSVVYVDAGGGVGLVYRKRVLFDALGYRESSTLCRGDTSLAVLKVSGVNVGVLVCFELRFPEIARALARGGAEVIAVPAAWYSGVGKEEQLHFLTQARASENTVFVATVNQAGDPFTGRSVVADPYGFKMLDLGAGPRYVEALLDGSLIAEARRRLPLLDLVPLASDAASSPIRRLEL
jgi:predicted amidohydrolase